MSKIYKFEAEIKKVSDVDGVILKAEFGKGRVPVITTFDGEVYEYQKRY